MVRLRNRAKNLDDEGLYVEAAMNLEAAAVIEHHRSKDCAVLLEIKKLEEDSIKLEAMIREFMGLLDENHTD